MKFTEVSVGDYKCVMSFSNWQQNLVMFMVNEHIVTTINEAFSRQIIAKEDLKFLTEVTFINTEV